MRDVMRYGSAVLIGAACMLGACSKGDSTADSTAAATASDSAAMGTVPGAASDSAATAATASTMSSANVLSLIGLTNAAEIGAGKTAEDKATNADVKAFAKMMVADHQAMQKQGDSLGTAKSISPEPPPQADQKRQAGDQMMQTLNATPKGAAFDKAYIDSQVSAHQQALNDLQTMAGATTDADVKALIEKAIPKVQEHLDKAQQLQSKLATP